jgi:hypothetical protein
MYGRVVSRAEISEQVSVQKGTDNPYWVGGHFLQRLIIMTARAGVWKRKREDLKKRRAPLFKRYEKSPNDLDLALEIKMIDDQIAECTQQMEQENALALASARSSTTTPRQRPRLASPLA